MKTGPNGLALIKHFEQCRLEAFKPIPTDPPTIGWGRAHGVQMGDTCTQDEADRMLGEDLRHSEDAVNRLVKVPVTSNQFDALVSFVYNCGEAAFEDSTLLRNLNIYAFESAAAQFARWNKSKGVVLNGLTRRREAERKLFTTPDNVPYVMAA